MRNFIILLLIILTSACNNSSKKQDQITDSSKTVQDPTVLPAQPDTIFTGMGNEPFWVVYVIRNDKIIYHPADGPDITVPFVNSSAPDSITTKYNSSNDSVTMELTFIKKDCSDGMSDIIHPYETKLMINAMHLNGCGKYGHQ